jgi:ATP:cob(I)alamin adenosyltransferase
MPIYTKKGDRGTTSFFNSQPGVRASKDSLKPETLGALDELNSFLGVCRSFCDSPERNVFIKDIQENIFTICSVIAGADLKFNKSKTTRLEKEIDKIEKKVGAIESFRFSQGSRFATHLMYSRALARRAERRVVALSKEEKIRPQILQYVNRLSDMLFMLFREANFDSGISEEGWTPRRQGSAGHVPKKKN